MFGRHSGPYSSYFHFDFVEEPDMTFKQAEENSETSQGVIACGVLETTYRCMLLLKLQWTILTSQF